MPSWYIVLRRWWIQLVKRYIHAIWWASTNYKLLLRLMYDNRHRTVETHLRFARGNLSLSSRLLVVWRLLPEASCQISSPQVALPWAWNCMVHYALVGECRGLVWISVLQLRLCAARLRYIRIFPELIEFGAMFFVLVGYRQFASPVVVQEVGVVPLDYLAYFQLLENVGCRLVIQVIGRLNRGARQCIRKILVICKVDYFRTGWGLDMEARWCLANFATESDELAIMIKMDLCGYKTITPHATRNGESSMKDSKALTCAIRILLAVTVTVVLHNGLRFTVRITRLSCLWNSTSVIQLNMSLFHRSSVLSTTDRRIIRIDTGGKLKKSILLLLWNLFFLNVLIYSVPRRMGTAKVLTIWNMTRMLLSSIRMCNKIFPSTSILWLIARFSRGLL